MPKIAIIGTTAWGTTLAVLLAREKRRVSLWARTLEEAVELKQNPDLQLAIEIPFLHITSSLRTALNHTDAVILAVPSQAVRRNIQLAAPYLKSQTLIINAAKGLEIGSNKRLSAVIAEEIKPEMRTNICVLSGPNLAKELLQGLPASAVVAAADATVAQRAQELLRTATFSVYTHSDVIGVELGGALKNVIALGAGMVDGLGYGDNAKAAFITRGLTEMAALGVALGASPLTLSGLTGLGDLIATCASTLSRNHYVGVELAKGRPLEEITSSMTGVAEGIATTCAAWNLAQQLKLGMPLTEKIYGILYRGEEPEEVIADIILDGGGKHELAGRKWQLIEHFRHQK